MSVSTRMSAVRVSKDRMFMYMARTPSRSCPGFDPKFVVRVDLDSEAASNGSALSSDSSAMPSCGRERPATLLTQFVISLSAFI